MGKQNATAAIAASQMVCLRCTCASWKIFTPGYGATVSNPASGRSDNFIAWLQESNGTNRIFRFRREPANFGKICLRIRLTLHCMSGNSTSTEVTIWLQQWAEGEPTALDHLAPLVYDQLRVIADNLLRNEANGHILQPTALVSETFLKLLDLHKVTLNDRSHFFAFAARLMRRVLIDHARREKAGKRFSVGRLPLDPELGWAGSVNEQSLDLNSALDELESLDATGIRALELRYFL